MKCHTKHNPSVTIALNAIVLPEAVFQGSERQIPLPVRLFQFQLYSGKLQNNFNILVVFH